MAQPSSSNPSWAEPTEPAASATPSWAAPDAAGASVPDWAEAAPNVVRSSGEDLDGVTLEELADIAQRRGVDLEQLKFVAPFYVPIATRDFDAVNPVEHGAKQAAGFLGASVGMNVPQWLYKVKQDEGMAGALDELQGINQERAGILRQVTEGVTGGHIGVGLSRAAGAANKVYDAVAPVVSGAVMGAAGSQSGEELEEAKEGALFGAGFVAGAHVLGQASKIFRKPGGSGPDETVEALKDIKALEKAGKDIAERSESQAALLSKEVREALPAAIKAEAKALSKAGDAANSAALNKLRDTELEVKQFANFLDSGKLENLNDKRGLQNAINKLDEVQATAGDEFYQSQLARFRQAQALPEVIGEKFKHMSPQVNAFRQILNKIIDGRYAMRDIDRKLGTNAEVVQGKLSEAIRKTTVDVGARLNAVKPVLKSIVDEKVDPSLVSQAIRAGKPTGNATVDKAAQFFQNAFEEGRQELVKRGIPIAKRANYVPNMIKEMPEVVANLKKAGEGIDLGAIASMDNAAFKAWKEASPRHKELADSLSYIFKEKPTDSGAQFVKNFHIGTDVQGLAENYDTVVGAAYRRTVEEIPALIREDNIFKLYNGWINSSFKAANIREPLAQLRHVRNIAKAKKDRVAVDYIDDLITDLSGSRSGTMAGWSKSQNAKNKLLFREKAKDEKLPQWKRAGYNWLAEYGGDAVQSILMQQYANLLGLSPKAFIMNLTQPYVQTIPEIGNVYGSLLARQALFGIGGMKSGMAKTITLTAQGAELINRAAGKTIARPGQQYKTKSMRLILENDGIMGKQWTTELRDALRSGIATHKGTEKVLGGLDGMTNALMLTQEWSETINRMMAREMGHGMARDLLAPVGKLSKFRQKQANQFIDSLSPAYQDELRRVMRDGSEYELGTALAKYIGDKTMYAYDRATMSQFGRSAGSLFTTFTKFPLSVGGDFVDTYRAKGAVKGTGDLAYRYMWPALALAGATQLWKGMTGEEELSDTTKLFLGPKGPAGSAPISSLGALVEGSNFRPPVVQAVADMVTGVGAAAAEGDAEPLWKAVNNAAAMYMPGARLMNIWSTDIPTITTGERPEGTFSQRFLQSIGIDAQPDDAVKGD